MALRQLGGPVKMLMGWIISTRQPRRGDRGYAPGRWLRDNRQRATTGAIPPRILVTN